MSLPPSDRLGIFRGRRARFPHPYRSLVRDRPADRCVRRSWVTRTRGNHWPLCEANPLCVALWRKRDDDFGPRPAGLRARSSRPSPRSVRCSRRRCIRA